MTKRNVNHFFPGEKKRQIGRPKLKLENRRSVGLEVSLRPKEAKLLGLLAKAKGKTFSTWAREVLLEAAEPAGIVKLQLG